METQRNHTRTTGAQDHRKSTHGDYNNALEGFYRQLETTRGKYTLLTTKRKYKASSHFKQAYNSRLTIQAQQENKNRRCANCIYNVSIFCQKVSIF